MIEALLIVSAVGLSMGSFVNVCAYRIPRKISIVSIRSFCPNCNRTLFWFELIPLVSYIIQRGHCRSCSERIPLQYPLVEVLTSLVLLLCFSRIGLSPRAISSSSFIVLMLLVGIIDWKHMVIPNSLVISGLVIGLVLRWVFEPASLLLALVSGAAAFSMMLMIRMAGNRVLGKESMGMGDVKLTGVLGLFLGFDGFLVSLWCAAILGMMFGLRMRFNPYFPAARNGTGKDELSVDGRIPFGTFLAIASSIVVLFRDSVEYMVVTWLTLMQ